MEIDQKCKEVQERYGWSQRRLADEIGMTEPNLISARKGRRPMPAHALAKVERLRGVDDASIVDQIIKTAACVAIAIVFLFWTPAENRAIASNTYEAQAADNTNYRCFGMLLHPTVPHVNGGLKQSDMEIVQNVPSHLFGVCSQIPVGMHGCRVSRPLQQWQIARAVREEMDLRKGRPASALCLKPG